ncbi:oligosaccharide flippase family protein [Riemerella anatipestifer]|uniref:oligosaccharide flippase family protein n=1 Tax=Riemerella anatipestifer TaxID=34085 RepID=UPI002364470A|nr:oligosaccharide flippase family protein [Riemerella anatipestifer]MDD1596970.1 oligosaccharide flippase family protein [Riemerella anatipestifer]MDY3338481.1 oligosaccharide flippase family protein [Riemerella anatipestifer]
MILKNKIKLILANDLNKKILNGGGWILLGNIISKFILLVATILLAKYLGKDEYGQFGIIKSTILMFAMFAGLELGMTSTKYISQYKIRDKDKVRRVVGLSTLFSMVISCLVSFLVCVFAPQIASQINAPKLNDIIRISSLALLFSSLNGIQGGILAGLEKFKEISINNVLAGCISSVLLIVAARYFNLKWVVVAFVLNFFFLFLFNFLTLRKSFYSEFDVKLFSRENFKELEVLWKFSFPAILAGMMISPVVWICNYFLVNQPNGYSAMAEFDIANQWRNTILFIPTALAQIVLPMLASSVDDREEYKVIFNKNLKVNFVLGFFMVFIFIVLTPLIVHFYGENYERTTYPMIIMFITTGFITVNNVIGQAIASQGRMWLGFYVNLLWAIVLISNCYLLVDIYQLGAVGISLAYLISYVVHTFLQFLYVKQFL